MYSSLLSAGFIHASITPFEPAPTYLKLFALSTAVDTMTLVPYAASLGQYFGSVIFAKSIDPDAPPTTFIRIHTFPFSTYARTHDAYSVSVTKSSMSLYSSLLFCPKCLSSIYEETFCFCAAYQSTLKRPPDQQACRSVWIRWPSSDQSPER